MDFDFFHDEYRGIVTLFTITYFNYAKSVDMAMTPIKYLGPCTLSLIILVILFTKRVTYF